MDEETAFLAAICANPADDTARLVYADWLQEQGQEERAEFIRVQVAIARTSAEDQCAQCYATAEGVQKTNGPCRCAKALRSLRRRSRELLAFDWCPVTIPRTTPRIRTETCDIELLDGDGLRAAFRFRRGFVDRCWLPAADWLAHGDAIVAAHPVTAVRLTSRPIVAGGAYGSYWLPHDPERKAFPVTQVHAICRDWTGEAPPDVTSSDLKALVTLELRWPGTTFALP